MTYRGYDEIHYKILRKKIDKLFDDWWHYHGHDKEEKARRWDEYIAAIHAASEIAPPVAEVWKLEMEELK